MTSEISRVLVRDEGFPKDLAGDLGRLLARRLDADYEGVSVETPEEAEWAVSRAAAFLEAVEAHLNLGK